MVDQHVTTNAGWFRAGPSIRVKLRGFLIRLVRTDGDSTAFVLRIALALAMFPHGAQKLLGLFGGHGFSGTIAGFEQGFGIAAPFAFLAIIAEFFGPLALVVGLFSRVAAFALGVVMLVAIRFHVPHGFFMNWSGTQAGEGYEYHILALGIAVALTIKGAGRWSLDRRIEASPGA